MTGCRHNAKNTLVKNYLYLAEQAGAEVHAADDGDRACARAPAAATRSTTELHQGQARAAGATRTFTAEQVVFAAGALGTQKLLHRLKAEGAPAAALRPARAS